MNELPERDAGKVALPLVGRMKNPCTPSALMILRHSLTIFMLAVYVSVPMYDSANDRNPSAYSSANVCPDKIIWNRIIQQTRWSRHWRDFLPSPFYPLGFIIRMHLLMHGLTEILITLIQCLHPKAWSKQYISDTKYWFAKLLIFHKIVQFFMSQHLTL
jgi:hypothetical protein